MSFVRGTWRVLVGIKDLLVLLLLLLFFVGLWAALNARSPLTVPSGAALVLDLDGSVVEQATPGTAFAFFSGADTPPEIQVRDIIAALNSGRTDSRIKAAVLDLDTFLGAGQANLQSIGVALRSFKAAGKPVYAYATAYTDDGYYLASQATSAWINPLGGVLLSGPGGPNLYFKAALDKLDIDIEVFKVGTYKSAVEPFTRGDASPEAEKVEQILVDSLWDSYAADVAAARKGANVDAFLSNLPARVRAENGDFATTALKAGLIDRIGNRAEFGRMVAKTVGAGSDGRPGSFNGIKLRPYRAATKATGSGDAVGIVYVAGTIVDGEAPAGTAGGDTIAEQIDLALANRDIKALVVRIDSPGGSVLASEHIREALSEARGRGIPVVASFGPVAASGGYWIATAADEIVAQPSTITGSIGVFAIIPTFNRALKELGIGTDGVKSTPYSGDPDVLRGLTPETRDILQASVEDVYRRFTGLVAKARDLPQARVDAIGQGRVWAGTTAKQIGLVDQLGGLDVAVAAAARRARLPEGTRTIDVEQTPPLLGQLFASALGAGEGDDAESTARDPFARAAALSRLRLFAALGEAQAIARGPTIQAHCLSCSTLSAPRPVAVAAGSGWLAKLTGTVLGR
jgi:protease-4